MSCISESITRQVKNNLEKEKRTVAELKDRRSRLESDKSRASTDDEKNEISERPRQGQARLRV